MAGVFGKEVLTLSYTNGRGFWCVCVSAYSEHPYSLLNTFFKLRMIQNRNDIALGAHLL